MNSQGISNLLWEFSTAHQSDQHLFSSLVRTTVELLNDCNSQALANIAWSHAVSNVDADHLFGNKSPFIKVCLNKENEFDRQGLSALHQWNLW